MSTNIPLHVFREYDIRGLVATELTPAFAEQLGRGYARFLLDKNPGAQSIALGRDHRMSSEGLAAAFSRGVRSHGVEVVTIGVVPTPLCYFAANVLPVDGLCMITGSHNPPEYNGFKIGIGKTTLAGPEVQELKQYALTAKDGGRQARETAYDVVTPYTHSTVQTLGLAERPLKVVCGSGNGTGGIVG